MNVLILTPDRVGSTLLQRLVTIYMLRKGFDKPVINLHELTNGLVKYHNPLLNKEVLGKPDGTKWGYYQSLSEITNYLATADHYKTSRLAHYHIQKRQDSIAEQVKFYEYLNENFFIISCRRNNLFEHALSWCIFAHSKTLNVYSPQHKVDVFNDIYQNKIEVNKESLTRHLVKYRDYLNWVDTYFDVQSYFTYESNISNLEQYILNLDFMKNSENNTWEDMFGQSWNQYNTVHRLLPNMKLQQSTDADTVPVNINQLILDKSTYQQLAGPDWPQLTSNYVVPETLPASVQAELVTLFDKKPWQAMLPKDDAEFLQQQINPYKNTTMQISDLVDNGFLVTGVPIKLQTLREKKSIISNFDQCIKWYNQWVHENNLGEKYTEAELDDSAAKEDSMLKSLIRDYLLPSYDVISK